MVIPKGYKQTEVGVIPEDWECRKIGDIAQVKMCKRIFADQTTESGEIPFYKIGTFGRNPDAYISRVLYEEYKAKYSYPKTGDILISAAGTLGRTVVFDGKDAYFQDSNIVWLDADHSVLSNQYLKHYYKVIKWASSEGSTISRLYSGIIGDTYIAIPPIEEQEKIAVALSNLDELISSLEKLITKYKAIKQSCMQNMFPRDGKTEPKMRLPGFTGAWEQRKVSEITNFHKQGFYTTESYDGNKKYYLLRGTDLTENKLILRDTPKIDATDKDYQAFKTQIGDFLIVRSGTVGTYGIVYEDISAIFGSYLIDFRFDKTQVTNEFFGYFYQSDLFKNQLRQIIQQSANTNINAENIKSTSINLPSLPEQKKIGDFFAGLDTLITLHQRKLKKLKEVKHGMMQQLLTGKIRLE